MIEGLDKEKLRRLASAMGRDVDDVSRFVQDVITLAFAKRSNFKMFMLLSALQRGEKVCFISPEVLGSENPCGERQSILIDDCLLGQEDPTEYLRTFKQVPQIARWLGELEQALRSPRKVEVYDDFGCAKIPPSTLLDRFAKLFPINTVRIDRDGKATVTQVDGACGVHVALPWHDEDFLTRVRRSVML